MTNLLLDAAYEYISLGLRVIALTGKTPNTDVHRTWSYDQSFYEGRGDAYMKLAFEHWATTGIGILTGPVYYVVDIDGEEGARQWRDIAGLDYMPDRWVAKTGRGLHLWYASSHQWPTTKLGPKLDFKGFGGYVAAPPSQHPDGPIYEWLLPPDAALPPWEMPDFLTEHLNAAKWAKDRAKNDAEVKVRNRVALGEDGIISNTQSFAGIIRVMTEAPEGSRNNVLNWAAYQMAVDGGDEADFVQLREAALATGMTLHETARTIQSARRALR